MRNRKVSRLVAGAFILNPDRLPIVDHIDRNRANDTVENLRWASNEDNSINRTRDSGKAVIQWMRDGTRIAEYPSIVAASEATGINRSNIGACANRVGNRETAGGYEWDWMALVIHAVFPNEIWRPLVIQHLELKDPGRQVSNYGRIKHVGTREMMSHSLRNGYPVVGVGIDDEHRTVGVHILVASLFVDGRTKERCYVNHKDEVRINARASNLEWVTLAENAAHSAYQHRKAVEQLDTQTGEVLATFESIKEAAFATGLRRGTAISNVLAGRSLTAAGFGWRLVEERG